MQVNWPKKYDEKTFQEYLVSGIAFLLKTLIIPSTKNGVFRESQEIRMHRSVFNNLYSI